MATTRLADAGDAPRCAEIYAPYVRETATSFESSPPSPAEFEERIDTTPESHPWWAWERDEVGQAATTETLQYTVFMYVVALTLVVITGGLLAVLGYRTAAVGTLIFGIWFTAFIGSINIGWELLQYRSERRRAESPDSPDDGPQRELAPDFSLDEDTKIGFVVTVLALVVLFVSFELARWLIGLI
jgi:hypothetical protein